MEYKSAIKAQKDYGLAVSDEKNDTSEQVSNGGDDDIFVAIMVFDQVRESIQIQVLKNLNYYIKVAGKEKASILEENKISSFLIYQFFGNSSRGVIENSILCILSYISNNFLPVGKFFDEDFVKYLFNIIIIPRNLSAASDKMRLSSFTIFFTLLDLSPTQVFAIVNPNDLIQGVMAVLKTEHEQSALERVASILALLCGSHYSLPIDTLFPVLEILSSLESYVNCDYFPHLCETAVNFISCGDNFATAFCDNVDVSMLFRLIPRVDGKSLLKLIDVLEVLIENITSEKYFVRAFAWEPFVSIIQYERREEREAFYGLVIQVLRRQADLVMMPSFKKEILPRLLSQFVSDKFELKEEMIELFHLLITTGDQEIFDIIIGAGFTNAACTIIESIQGNKLGILIKSLLAIYERLQNEQSPELNSLIGESQLVDSLRNIENDVDEETSVSIKSLLELTVG